mmetsp:Transcript_23052/g.52176  ORF Transcript_23052/g.52176 Transcript_23052/m.52176 type:complete len:137 (-) Transcript_23052:66-476(-)
MGMGMGMGGYGMGMGGPMGMLYTVNYFISMVGQVTAMLGMGSQAVGHLFVVARDALLKLEKTIRQSEIRRWLQRKSHKSPILRFLFIVSSVLLASQIVRLARYLIESQMGPKALPSTSAIRTAAGIASAVTLPPGV